MRRSRNSASVPPGERPGERKEPSKGLPTALPARPELKRSNSSSKLELGDKVKIANGSPMSSTNDGGLVGDIKGKHEADIEYNPQQKQRSSIGDVMVTPSIKKRLFKMGGKVGGKLFKLADLPLDESVSETNRTNDNLEGLPRQSHQQINGEMVPPTPTFQRFLGKMWGKSEGKSDHGKHVAPPNATEIVASDATLPEADDIDSGDEKANEVNDDDPFESFSPGLVLTAKGMRPNRPNTNQRRKQPQRRRGSNKTAGHDVQLERKGAARKQRPMRRTKSSDSISKSSTRQTNESQSDSSSVGGSDNNALPSKPIEIEVDPLGDRLSEAESIDSMDF